MNQKELDRIGRVLNVFSPAARQAAILAERLRKKAAASPGATGKKRPGAVTPPKPGNKKPGTTASSKPIDGVAAGSAKALARVRTSRQEMLQQKIEDIKKAKASNPRREEIRQKIDAIKKGKAAATAENKPKVQERVAAAKEKQAEREVPENEKRL